MQRKYNKFKYNNFNLLNKISIEYLGVISTYLAKVENMVS